MALTIRQKRSVAIRLNETRDIHQAPLGTILICVSHARNHAAPVYFGVSYCSDRVIRSGSPGFAETR